MIKKNYPNRKFGFIRLNFDQTRISWRPNLGLKIVTIRFKYVLESNFGFYSLRWHNIGKMIKHKPNRKFVFICINFDQTRISQIPNLGLTMVKIGFLGYFDRCVMVKHAPNRKFVFIWVNFDQSIFKTQIRPN